MASSVLEPHALLSTCSVSRGSVVFGSRHSCLVSGSVLVSCRGSDTHAPGMVLLWGLAVSSSLGPSASLSMCIRCRVLLHAALFGCMLSLVLSCSVWYAACVFHWMRAFMFVMFCVNTRLMSLLISCVFMSRIAHG